MKKQSKVSALVLALALLSVSGLANAAFKPGMSKAEVAAEIQTQLKARKPLAAIAAEAKAVGVPAADMTIALIQAGQNPVAVAQEVTTANPEQAAAIFTVAKGMAPGFSTEIEQAVLGVPGVNPSDVLTETAIGQLTVQPIQTTLPPFQSVPVAENPSQVGSAN